MGSCKKSLTRKKAKQKGFRSGFELKVAEQLEQDGATWAYEEDSFPYTIPVSVHTYLCDFKVSARGGDIYIETKGKLTLEDRKKLVYVRDQHQIDLRLLFQNANNKLRRGSKTTYGEWATKNGFKWAHKGIPKAWFKEFY